MNTQPLGQFYNVIRTLGQNTIILEYQAGLGKWLSVHLQTKWLWV